MNKTLNFKKGLLVSLIGPVLVIIRRLTVIIGSYISYGTGDNYYCSLSLDTKCSFVDYVLKSDEAVLTYIGIPASFIFLFVAVNYVYFLINIFKNNRTNLFWILAILPFIVIFLLTFIL